MDGIVPVIYLSLYVGVGICLLIALITMALIINKKFKQAFNFAKYNMLLSVIITCIYLLSMKTIIGYELLLPAAIFSLLFISIMFFLLVSKKNKSTKK